MPTISEALEKVLDELLTTNGGIEASALVSRDGLLMASNVGGDLRPETFAALGASISNVAESALAKLNKGAVNRIIVETKDGNIITESVDTKALLVTLTKRGPSELRPILSDIEKAANKVKKTL
ncbi:MAG: roadblock/LC7 domain-containing protein [Halobacteriota archaeon]|nr:roadblock/LC7 domain-containing protein [Halobacteriota archaeon]MDY6958673.1 roadblock/LC7 domain-containing protein [Halobacteriota archaeon]